ncbi:hypothetical protein [Archangium primigenium]|uniref:hypothetical protein n=1 Tax=[Archangium] primigenium TaxID=2792470 RepID=UPI00195E754F|nr:hypothetical protein [Archangium primigenium]MBM7116515.1 hypothetical protein [Archangium primigenium]
MDWRQRLRAVSRLTLVGWAVAFVIQYVLGQWLLTESSVCAPWGTRLSLFDRAVAPPFVWGLGTVMVAIAYLLAVVVTMVGKTPLAEALGLLPLMLLPVLLLGLGAWSFHRERTGGPRPWRWLNGARCSCWPSGSTSAPPCCSAWA